MSTEGIDVRNEEDEAGTEIPGGRVEFALFREGVYMESVFQTEAEALELYKTLGDILGVT